MIRRGLLPVLTLAIVLLGGGAAQAAFPGANGKLAFWGLDEDNDSCIYTMNTDGTGRAPVLPCDDWSETKPKWSPDGTEIAYEGYYGQLDIVDADGSNLRSFVYDSGVGMSGHGWSPDATKLVASWWEDFGPFPCCAFSSQIELTNGQDVLASDTDVLASVAWSPNGQWIAFSRDPVGSAPSQLSLVHPDGTSETPLTPGGGPSWSPDGQRIALSDFVAGSSEIFVINADGSGRTQLTFAPGTDREPAWSPAGDKIAFVSARDGNEEIYLMNPDGSGQTNVTNDPGYVRAPDWQPIPINSYPRPKGATPFLTYLVPAYAECTSANRVHGPSLEFASCNPPTQSSNALTIGSADSNGKPTKSVSSVRFDTVVGSPSIPGDQADVKITAQVIDVYTQAGLNDYAGEVTAKTTLRITDKLNIPHPGGPGAGTVSDIPYGFTIPCAETADTTIGGACLLSTSADALAPGAVTESKRSIWGLGQVAVYDANGDPFMKQGIFVP